MDCVRIRPLRPEERPQLAEFLYLAVFVPQGSEPPPRAIVKEPGVAVYIDGFGTRPGDDALCAERDGALLGAVWVRNIRGYGYLDGGTPEFAISVLPGARGRGIGFRLMREMLERLRTRGVKRASLAVQKENWPARSLYRKLGFVAAGETAEELILCIWPGAPLQDSDYQQNQ